MIVKEFKVGDLAALHYDESLYATYSGAELMQ